METICQYTGLRLSVPHLSSKIRVRFYHPIFTLGLKNLIQIYDSGICPTNKEDTLLLTAAFLKATGHVEFHHPICGSPDQIHHICLSNLEPLAAITALIAGDLGEDLPTILITSETANLSNLGQWIELWKSALDERLATVEVRAKLSATRRLEARLSDYLQQKKLSGQFPKLLTLWIREAACFPTFEIRHPMRGDRAPISISDYWCEILEKSVRETDIYSLPLNDVQEIYDHLIENLEDVGSQFAHAALSSLQKIIFNQTQGLGISSSWSFTDAQGKVFSRNMQEKSAVQIATELRLDALASQFTSEPKRQDFPSVSEYLRASLAWKSKQIKTKNLGEEK